MTCKIFCKTSKNDISVYVISLWLSILPDFTTNVLLFPTEHIIYVPSLSPSL